MVVGLLRFIFLLSAFAFFSTQVTLASEGDCWSVPSTQKPLTIKTPVLDEESGNEDSSDDPDWLEVSQTPPTLFPNLKYFSALKHFCFGRSSLVLKSFVKKKLKWVSTPEKHAWGHRASTQKHYIFTIVDPFDDKRTIYCQGEVITTIQSFKTVGVVLTNAQSAEFLGNFFKNFSDLPFVTCSPPVSVRNFFSCFIADSESEENFFEERSVSFEQFFHIQKQEKKTMSDNSFSTILREFDPDDFTFLAHKMQSAYFSPMTFYSNFSLKTPSPKTPDTDLFAQRVFFDPQTLVGFSPDSPQEAAEQESPADLSQNSPQEAAEQESPIDLSQNSPQETAEQESPADLSPDSPQETAEQESPADLSQNSPQEKASPASDVSIIRNQDLFLEKTYKTFFSNKAFLELQNLPCFSEDTRAQQGHLLSFLQQHSNRVSAADLIAWDPDKKTFDYSFVDETEFKNIFMADRLLLLDLKHNSTQEPLVTHLDILRKLAQTCLNIVESLQLKEKTPFVSEGSLFHCIAQITNFSLTDQDISLDVSVICSKKYFEETFHKNLLTRGSEWDHKIKSIFEAKSGVADVGLLWY